MLPPESLRDRNVFIRHRWTFVCVTLLAWAGAAICYFTSKPLYESEAELLFIYIGGGPRDLIENPYTEEELNEGRKPVLEALTSRNLVEKVAQDVEGDHLLKDQGGGDPVSVVASGLTVITEKENRIIRIAFSHTDPETAQETLRILKDRCDEMCDRTLRDAMAYERFSVYMKKWVAVVTGEKGTEWDDWSNQWVPRPAIALQQMPTEPTPATKQRNRMVKGMLAGGPVLGVLMVMVLGRNGRRKVPGEGADMLRWL